MRFQLELELINPIFPVDYSRMMISFLKHSIESYYPELYKEMFKNEKGLSKSYTFDLFLNQAKFKDGFFEIEGNIVKMTLSSCSLQDSLLFHNAFLLQHNQMFYHKGEAVFKVKGVRMLPEPKIHQSEIFIKWMSPLVVLKHAGEKGQDIYLRPDDEEFDSQLAFSLNSQLNTLAPHLSLEGFTCEVIEAKPVVAWAFGQKFSATKGIFKLTGSPELLSFLYEAGLGNKRNAGFGMFDIILRERRGTKWIE
ncbi:MAG: CRISPR-associated endoribonuclease Cas6 [Turicibacter sp.]|nr:CRISPR-associated endoribonuclease Cas6 [Turicibacter sp.]